MATDVFQESSAITENYVNVIDPRIERILWHLEDDSKRNVVDELVFDMDHEEILAARDVLFMEAMKVLEAQDGAGQHATSTGMPLDTAYPKSTRLITVPWKMIKRRVPSIAANDLCELYLYRLDPEIGFPVKILKRKALNIAYDESFYDIPPLEVIHETKDEENQLVVNKVRNAVGEIFVENETLISTFIENADISVMVSSNLPSNEDLNGPDNEPTPQGTIPTASSSHSYVEPNVTNSNDDQPGQCTREPPKDPPETKSKGELLISTISENVSRNINTLTSAQCTINSVIDIIGNTTDIKNASANYLTTVSNRPCDKTSVMFESPNAATPTNPVVVNFPQPETVAAVKNQNVPYAPPTGATTLTTHVSPSRVKTPPNMQIASATTRDQPASPANPTGSTNHSTTSFGAEIVVKQPTPSKPVAKNPDLSQDSFLREIEEIHQYALASTPRTSKPVCANKGTCTYSEMATQTTPNEIYDPPVKKSELTSQMGYVDRALTNHERRMRANEVWCEREEEKVNKIDAELYTMFSELRVAHESLAEDHISLKKVVSDILMISPNYEQLVEKNNGPNAAMPENLIPQPNYPPYQRIASVVHMNEDPAPDHCFPQAKVNPSSVNDPIFRPVLMQTAPAATAPVVTQCGQNNYKADNVPMIMPRESLVNCNPYVTEYPTVDMAPVASHGRQINARSATDPMKTPVAASVISTPFLSDHSAPTVDSAPVMTQGRQNNAKLPMPRKISMMAPASSTHVAALQVPSVAATPAAVQSRQNDTRKANVPAKAPMMAPAVHTPYVAEYQASIPQRPGTAEPTQSTRINTKVQAQCGLPPQPLAPRDKNEQRAKRATVSVNDMYKLPPQNGSAKDLRPIEKKRSESPADSFLKEAKRVFTPQTSKRQTGAGSKPPNLNNNNPKRLTSTPGASSAPTQTIALSNMYSVLDPQSVEIPPTTTPQRTEQKKILGPVDLSSPEDFPPLPRRVQEVPNQVRADQINDEHSIDTNNINESWADFDEEDDKTIDAFLASVDMANTDGNEIESPQVSHDHDMPQPNAIIDSVPDTTECSHPVDVPGNVSPMNLILQALPGDSSQNTRYPQHRGPAGPPAQHGAVHQYLPPQRVDSGVVVSNCMKQNNPGTQVNARESVPNSYLSLPPPQEDSSGPRSGPHNGARPKTFQRQSDPQGAVGGAVKTANHGVNSVRSDMPHPTQAMPLPKSAPNMARYGAPNSGRQRTSDFPPQHAPQVMKQTNNKPNMAQNGVQNSGRQRTSDPVPRSDPPREHPDRVVSRNGWTTKSKKRKRTRSSPKTQSTISGGETKPYRDVFVRNIKTDNYVGPEDMADAVQDYCEERGVGVFFIKVMNSLYEGFANIKLTVATCDYTTVVDGDFWPENVSPREWYIKDKKFVSEDAD